VTQSSCSRRKPVRTTVLRISIAVVLFAIVLALVPFRDRLSWPGVVGPEALKGKIERTDGEVIFRADNGSEFRLRLDPAAARGMFGSVRITRPRMEPVDRLLSREDQKELEGEPEQGLITTLINVSVGPFLIAVLVYLLAAAISFQRWHVLLRAVNVGAPFARVFKLGFIGLFFSNIIPGMTGGDLVKAIYVARDHRQQKTEAVLSVIVDRVIGLLALAIVAAFVLLLVLVDGDLLGNAAERSRQELKRLAAVVDLILLAIVVAGCVFFSRRIRRAILLDRLLERLPFAGLLKKIDRAILLFRAAPRAVAYSVAISLVIHVVVLTSIAFVGQALRIELSSILFYFALAPLPLILQSIPMTPGGIGVGETAFVFIFCNVARLLSAQQALALALTYRVVQLLVSLIGGLFLLTSHEKPIAPGEEDIDEATEVSASISG